jgi:hypothetical protein
MGAGLLAFHATVMGVKRAGLLLGGLADLVLHHLGLDGAHHFVLQVGGHADHPFLGH